MALLKVSFTGTRHGMSEKQMREFRLMAAREQWDEFHHGDCIGADAQAHYLVREAAPDCRIHVHPGGERTEPLRAGMAGDVMHKVKSAIARNYDIVDCGLWLIACPQTADEELRSGTWATVRYARRAGKSTTIIYP